MYAWLNHVWIFKRLLQMCSLEGWHYENALKAHIYSVIMFNKRSIYNANDAIIIIVVNRLEFDKKFTSYIGPMIGHLGKLPEEVYKHLEIKFQLWNTLYKSLW